MDGEDVTRWFENQRSQSPLVRVFSQYLSAQEAAEIFDQFHSKNWIPNGQVLWSGIPRRTAQEWADLHHLQTLTTAMGVLMNENHPACPKWKKTTQQWSKYIHGASAIFAWHIAQGEKVIVLSPPPPERFNPSGLSSFQVIESPIVQGLICQSSVHRVMMAHPTVTESEGFLYEAWPQDRSSLWLARFGLGNTGTKWRNTGRSADKLRLKQLVAVYSEQTHFSTQPVGQLEKKEVRGLSHLIKSAKQCSWSFLGEFHRRYPPRVTIARHYNHVIQMHDVGYIRFVVHAGQESIQSSSSPKFAIRGDGGPRGARFEAR